MQTETRTRKEEGESTTTTARREGRPNRPFEGGVRIREAPYGFPSAAEFGHGGYGYAQPITAFGTAGSFGVPVSPIAGPGVPPTGYAVHPAYGPYNAAYPYPAANPSAPPASFLAPFANIGPTLSYGLAGVADLLHRGVNLATQQGQAFINAWQMPYGASGIGPQQVAWPNARLPPTDIVDEGAELVCQVELPGVKPENIDVAAHGRALLVTAQAEPDIDLGALVQAERGLQVTYRRSILLPTTVQPSGAKARLRDGVLTINLPKVDATEGTRRIPVES